MRKKSEEKAEKIILDNNTRIEAALEEIKAERKRQVEVLKYDANNDDKYKAGELYRAANGMFRLGSLMLEGVTQTSAVKDVLANKSVSWPFDKKWLQAKDTKDAFIKAGALYIAEGERAERAGTRSDYVELIKNNARFCAVQIVRFNERTGT